jgi:hypothetical protein
VSGVSRSGLLFLGLVAIALAVARSNTASPSTRGAVDEAAPRSVPTIDGVVRAAEWSGASRDGLTGGGEVLRLRVRDELYVAVKGKSPGIASLCVGNARRVAVLHASAALGTVVYTLRGNDRWSRGPQFEWRVRASPRTGPASAAERATFLAENRWLANSGHRPLLVREFRLRLDADRQFLGATHLATDSMEIAYWPESMADGCRSANLVRGDAPDTLEFSPLRWHCVD